METTPAIDTAIDFFDAHTVELGVDVRDRTADAIIDVRSDEGSTVRFYNAAEEEFMEIRTDRVSKLFDEKLRGARHAEDGRLYAILADPDGKGTYEEPVDVLPFAELVTATRPYADGEADGLL